MALKGILSSTSKNKIQSKNIVIGFFFKFLGITLNLVLIPLLIKFLGKVEYGVWVTVFSVINWIFAFDLGIGTGLRNKLTEALTLNNYKLSGQIIVTSYVIISLLALGIFIAVVPFIGYLSFQSILNYSGQTEVFLKLFIGFSIMFTVINFVLSLYKKLYLSIHKSYVIEFSNSIFILIYLTAVYYYIKVGLEKDLLILIKIYGALSILISTVFTILFFKMNKKLRITIKMFKFKLVKPLFQLGGKFFLINLCLLVILFSDNLIIANLLGPSYVSDYSVVQRLFQLFTVVFSVIIASSWSLYSQAIIDRDFHWILKNLRKMHYYLFYFFLIVCAVCLFLDEILIIWIGKNVINIPRGLVLSNLFYFIIYAYANIYMYFINATGEINLQLKLYVFGALINVPLSVLLVNVLNSTTGVMLATVICTLPLAIAMPIQTKSVLKRLSKSNRK